MWDRLADAGLAKQRRTKDVFRLASCIHRLALQVLERCGSHSKIAAPAAGVIRWLKQHWGVKIPCAKCSLVLASQKTWRLHRQERHGEIMASDVSKSPIRAATVTNHNLPIVEDDQQNETPQTRGSRSSSRRTKTNSPSGSRSSDSFHKVISTTGAIAFCHGRIELLSTLFAQPDFRNSTMQATSAGSHIRSPVMEAHALAIVALSAASLRADSDLAKSYQNDVYKGAVQRIVEAMGEVEGEVELGDDAKPAKDVFKSDL